jgi:hypothetical protein
VKGGVAAEEEEGTVEPEVAAAEPEAKPESRPRAEEGILTPVEQ